MLKIWNAKLAKPLQKVTYSHQRNKKLLGLWKNQLQKDLKKWEEFCNSISSSKFLMGEKKSTFKACFDWLIDPSIANRVLNGEFGIGDRTPQTFEQEEINDKILKIKDRAQQIRLNDLNVIKQKYFKNHVEKEKVKDVFIAYMRDIFEKKIKVLDVWKYNSNWYFNQKTFNYLFEHFILYYYLGRDDDYYKSEANK